MTTGSNFNWIAPVYDALAFMVFGHRLRRAQIIFLNRIPANASVLIVGGGAGWILEQVLLKCHPKKIVYLETSSQMVALAGGRMLRKSLTGFVDFRVGDDTALVPDEQFDVIITSFVLDLFTETTLQTRFLPPLLNVLKPTGIWLVTDFVQPKVSWQKALLWVMIRFFRLTAGIEAKTLVNWQQGLRLAGLVQKERQRQVGGMVSAEVWTR
ncbi:class I SAM-dependent methyltransferase [Spirosoma pollinicola]|uniref:SAM-dependent methyltransferase n=1 Tax=Spirosoma pollinicola TaxID=2057025 RepID=A0A2K8YZ28_9BACT|nr:methyltransferase domain-containing protein [Spirosoma pollinicola]AUD02865.1 SAM-dependent methyltransferase [Spirosoma pollinicola]